MAKFNRHYTYDGVNRLQTASEDNHWSRQYSYDQYGNLSLTGSSGLNPSPLTPQAQNGYNPYNPATN